MQISITGGNGFIGRKLVDALVSQGHSIRVLSRVVTRQKQAVFPASVALIQGDLTKDDCPLNQFLEGCDVLFHCAASISDPNSMVSLHVEGSKRLLEAAIHQSNASHKKIHWVQLSSCGAYGPPRDRPDHERTVHEFTPHNPSTEYERSKTMSDLLLIEACKNQEMTFAILRPSNVIGADMPNQSLRKLIQHVKKGRFFYLGKPGAIATYVHVNDVVNALLSLAKHPEAKGKIFNLSNDCTLEALINKIADLSQVPYPSWRIPAPYVLAPLKMVSFLAKNWIHIPNLNALVFRTSYPSTKIESELDFKFSRPMPDAIEDLVLLSRDIDFSCY